MVNLGIPSKDLDQSSSVVCVLVKHLAIKGMFWYHMIYKKESLFTPGSEVSTLGSHTTWI